MSINNESHCKNSFSRLRQKLYPFFWFVAAADESLLQRCTIPEQDKQAGIGIAILCTAFAALISSYYAVYSLFENGFTSLGIAFFWAIIIFNLDRFMVGSIRKRKQQHIGNAMLVASPRILLALLIAVVISKPLEIKIFQNQIEEAKSSFRDSLLNSKFSFENNTLTKDENRQITTKKELDRLIAASKDLSLDADYVEYKKIYGECLNERAKFDSKIERYRSLKKNAIYNNDNYQVRVIEDKIVRLLRDRNALNCGSKKSNMDKRAQVYIQSQLGKVAVTEKQVEKIEQDIAVVRESLQKQASRADTAIYRATNKDMLGQMRILSSLTERDIGMRWVNNLITAIFFILEVAPVLIKVFSSRGEYDTLIAIAEKQALDNEEAAEEESNQQKIVRKAVAHKNTKQLSDIDEAVQKQVQEEILTAQADLAKQIVAAWKNQEEQLLKSDPVAYIEDKITRKI